MLKQWAKRALQCIGVQAYLRRNLPWGLNLEVDLGRLLSGNGGLVVFDVGANVGQTVHRLISLSRPGQFYAFEPVAKTYEVLLHNTSKYKGLNRFQLALGDYDGEAEMQLRESSEWNRIYEGGKSSENMLTEKVPIAKLDTFCSNHQVDIIHLFKTDCEGYDLEVLKGAHRMLSQGIIRGVLSEVNFLRNGWHGDFFQIHDYLTNRGYYFFALYDPCGWGPKYSACAYYNGLCLAPAK